MSDNLTSVLLALCVVVLPVWLTVNFLTRVFARQKISKADTATLENIASIASRMERRMDAVERILDAEAPAWRPDAPATGGYQKTG